MKKTILILSSVAGMLFTACNHSQTETTQKKNPIKDTMQTTPVHANFKSPKNVITVEEAFELSKQDAIFIDVREPEELAEVAFDVKNITNIPLGELESRLAEVPKDKQVIVVCRRGRRSSKAYDILKEKGFENISHMEGGMEAWQEKGLPVKKGK